MPSYTAVRLSPSEDGESDDDALGLKDNSTGVVYIAIPPRVDNYGYAFHLDSNNNISISMVYASCEELEENKSEIQEEEGVLLSLYPDYPTIRLNFVLVSCSVSPDDEMQFESYLTVGDWESEHKISQGTDPVYYRVAL